MTQYKYLRGSQDSREAVEFDLRSPEEAAKIVRDSKVKA